MPIPKPTEIPLSLVEAKSPDEIQNLVLCYTRRSNNSSRRHFHSRPQ